MLTSEAPWEPSLQTKAACSIEAKETLAVQRRVQHRGKSRALGRAKRIEAWCAKGFGT